LLIEDTPGCQEYGFSQTPGHIKKDSCDGTSP
jgi:hypothetical protein